MALLDEPAVALAEFQNQINVRQKLISIAPVTNQNQFMSLVSWCLRVKNKVLSNQPAELYAKSLNLVNKDST
ncbi:MAG: hypothetical protein R3C11_26990 [Planctomycetaceae bacterium]